MRQISLGRHQIQCEAIEESREVLPLIVKHVTEVHQGSPASKFGLRTGDFLVGINGKPAAHEDVMSIVAEGSETTYLFHRPDESRSFVITSSGLPLGLRDEYTTKTILRRAQDMDAEYDELYNLWERAEWSALLKASRSLSGDDSWLMKAISKVFRRPAQDPSVLMHGIALWELGTKEKALELIQNYEENYMDMWTTEWHALTYYYQGLNQLANGETDTAERYLYASEEYCRCPVLQTKLLDLGINASTDSPWHGRRFPIDFELQDFAQSQHYKLSEILADSDQKLVFLCVMPSYRANGPYDDIVQTYARIVNLLPDLVSPLFVITDEKELDESSPRRAWMVNEQRLIAEGTPIVLLYDEQRAVCDTLAQVTTPNIYLLNAEGAILNAGIDFEFDSLWPILQREFGDLFESQSSSPQ